MNPDSIASIRGCGGCGRAPSSLEEHLKGVLLALMKGQLSASQKEVLKLVLELTHQ